VLFSLASLVSFSRFVKTVIPAEKVVGKVVPNSETGKRENVPEGEKQA